MRNLVWFRADLRTVDNTALHHACRGEDGCIGLFIINPSEWKKHDVAPVRVQFVLRCVRELSDRLAKLNIPLIVVTAKREADVPRMVLEAAEKHRCAAVHFNREYEVNESIRDEHVRSVLAAKGIGVVPHDDQCILAPGTVRTREGGAFTVFTPFKNRWYTRHADIGGAPILPEPAVQAPIGGISPSEVPRSVDALASGISGTLWPGGQAEAAQRLARFVPEKLGVYKRDRDYPALPGTSVLSPYLAAGAISPRMCLRAALDANNGKLSSGSPGAVQWISELIWREFYIHIVQAFPRVSKGRAFKPATDRLRWSYNDEHFQRWCEGRTGVPIVDGAMRCLNATGWMHNRLRMIAAMYLTKDLFIDWRWGEKYFCQKLVDGTLASNNGGWQWSASTGTDAAPYFRIFNPTSQSKTYDERGDFIRAWVPELKDLDAKTIHAPHDADAGVAPLARARLDYPEPIVDHRRAVERVLREFKAISVGTGGEAAPGPASRKG